MTNSSSMLLRTRIPGTRGRTARRGLGWLLWVAPTFALATAQLGCSAGPAAPSSDSGGSTAGGRGPLGSAGGAGGTFVPGGGASGSGTSTGGTPPEVVDVGGVKITGAPTNYRVVRLTHDQWENSVRDVLMLSQVPGMAGSFFPDPKGNSNFSNNENGLEVNDTLRLDYERSAEEVAQKVTSDSAALTRLGNADSPTAFIAAIGKRAYRRALTADESAAYLELWNQGATFFASGNAFKDGAQVFLGALLQSPSFLYRTELADAGARLTGAELATKISYLLRNTTPTDELLASAESGALDTNEGLAIAVEQMFTEEIVASNVETFFHELYALSRQLGILKDTTMFPTFTEATAQALHESDLMFFGDLFASGQGVRDIFLSKTAFVNSDIAPIYGLTSRGTDLKKVTLDDTRPGFLTRAGFLATNATLKNPDPIHRGVDINVRMLCADLSPPPGVEIPPLPTPEPNQTNREAVTALTGEGFCGECHGGIINPPGFALEGFDATGKVRTMDAGKPVDTTGNFGAISGNPSFAGPADLAQIMAESETAHTCFSARLTEYALSRDLSSKDTDLVQSLAHESHTSAASLRNLLMVLIQSPSFTNANSPSP
jgi:hypothetical protein